MSLQGYPLLHNSLLAKEVFVSRAARGLMTSYVYNVISPAQNARLYLVSLAGYLQSPAYMFVSGTCHMC